MYIKPTLENAESADSGGGDDDDDDEDDEDDEGGADCDGGSGASSDGGCSWPEEALRDQSALWIDGRRVFLFVCVRADTWAQAHSA